MIQSVKRDRVSLPTDGHGDDATCSMRDGLAEPCYQSATQNQVRDLKPPTPQREKDSVPPQIREKDQALNTVLQIGRKPDTRSAAFSPKIREKPVSKHYSADRRDRRFLYPLPQLFQNHSMLLHE